MVYRSSSTWMKRTLNHSIKLVKICTNGSRMLTAVFPIIASLLIAVLGVLVYNSKNKNCPPGPFQWPFIGNLRLLRRLCREYRGQHGAFLELSRRYSSNLISLRLGRSNVIAVSGYEEIQKILGSDEFDGRPWNEFIKLRNMGMKKGITFSDGPEWKEARSWLVRSLRQVGFGRAEMSARMSEELQVILDGVSDGGVFRMKSLLAPAMINVVWTLATGKRFADDTKLKDFIELMVRRTKAFDMAGGILSVFPWIRHIAPEASGYKVLVTLNNEIKGLLMETIDEHKKNYVAGEAGGDLIDLFLAEMYAGKEPDSIFNENQLFMILLDLLIAGTTTTTDTLDFLFLRMTVHQDVQRRLHEEIDTVIGRDRFPDLNDRPKMPFTEAVLTESQRIQMVVPVIGPRRVTRDANVNGYRIPKESCLLLNVWSVHMNPDYYPNPHSFEPERFIKDGSHVADEKLIFFGRGHRRCPGEADARSALFLFFVGIMQRFQLLPAPGQGLPDVDPNIGLTLSPKPYEILLVPRQRDFSFKKLETKDDFIRNRGVSTR